MQAEIKDSNQNIRRALRLIGFNLDEKQLEKILNIADFVKSKDGDTTLKDLVELEKCVEDLFQ